MMSSMICNALNTNVNLAGLAPEFVGLIMQRTELMVISNLLFLAGHLQYYEILGQHVGFDLRVVLIAASGTV